MNQANKERVDQIKDIIVTLSDMKAIKEIKDFLHNSRSRIYDNGIRELRAKENDAPEPQL